MPYCMPPVTKSKGDMQYRCWPPGAARHSPLVANIVTNRSAVLPCRPKTKLYKASRRLTLCRFFSILGHLCSFLDFVLKREKLDIAIGDLHTKGQFNSFQNGRVTAILMAAVSTENTLVQVPTARARLAGGNQAPSSFPPGFQLIWLPY